MDVKIVRRPLPAHAGATLARLGDPCPPRTISRSGATARGWLVVAARRTCAWRRAATGASGKQICGRVWKYHAAGGTLPVSCATLAVACKCLCSLPLVRTEGVMVLAPTARTPGATCGQTSRAEGFYGGGRHCVAVTAWAEMVVMTLTTIISESNTSLYAVLTGRRTVVTTSAMAES